MTEDTKTELPKVIMADDDEAFREPYARLLRRHGFDCICAPDAATTTRLLNETDVDALIADIHMPGNVGLELIEQVPQIARGLPVILLTGLPSVETAARSVRLAVTAYLVKPPNLDELLSLLRDCVSRYRRLRALSDSQRHLEEWAGKIGALTENLRRAEKSGQHELAQDYLRITLQNLMLQLSDLDRSIAAWKQFDSGAKDIQQLTLVGAVRHAIEVLEKTRQNFHSKDLGELRRQLQNLLPPDAK
jgi:DNA-binding response OmpR family regulator